uniref:hypothetical protein n=1 Tax=Methylobacterium nigriterrae TaxID=3127512 RepID=UPI0030133BBB
QGGGKNDLYRKTPVVPAGGKERTYLGTTRVITGGREKMISIEIHPLSPGWITSVVGRQWEHHWAIEIMTPEGGQRGTLQEEREDDL